MARGRLECRLCRLLRRCLVEPTAEQRRLRRVGAPRACGHAAQADADGTDASVGVEFEAYRRGGDREGIGFAVADLEIERAAGPRSGRDVERGDQLTRAQDGLDVRRIARLAVQTLERDAAGVAVGVEQVYGGAERGEHDGEVAGVAGNAVPAGAEHGQQPVDPADCGTAGAGRALAAGGPARVAEVVAAGALQHVAAETCHVAQLGTCREPQRLRESRVVAQDCRVLRRFGHAHKGAEVEPVRVRRNRAMRVSESGDRDQRLGTQHVELHQVEHGGSAGQVVPRRVDDREAHGLRGVAGTLERERAHQAAVPARCGAAWATACTILG